MTFTIDRLTSVRTFEAIAPSMPLPAQPAVVNARPRRLRRLPGLRAMLRETTLAPDDFICPLFVTHGRRVRRPIRSMPGVCQLSIDQLAAEAELLCELGIPAVLLFGLPLQKDPIGSENFAADGIVQQAVRALKAAAPELIVITDVCMCEYTSHGHCGVLSTPHDGHVHLDDGYLLDEATLPILTQVALSHAEAGADMVAPSGMLDGAVRAIRSGLDRHGFAHLPILAYAVKYASSFYGPFREAAQGAPQFGDRKTHQMDPANVREALREAALDVAEGADMLMVKPALAYLDVIHRVRTTFPELPLVAYNVSGEYAMIKAAIANGWLSEAVILETLLGIKRAGADMIISYHAKEAARMLLDV